MSPTPLIEELQQHGVTLERIADALGISIRMVSHMKATGLEPRYTLAKMLMELHAKHCSTSVQGLS